MKTANESVRACSALLLAFVVAFVLALAGCQTFSGPSGPDDTMVICIVTAEEPPLDQDMPIARMYSVTIVHDPSGAEYRMFDRNGVIVCSGVPPGLYRMISLSQKKQFNSWDRDSFTTKSVTVTHALSNPPLFEVAPGAVTNLGEVGVPLAPRYRGLSRRAPPSKQTGRDLESWRGVGEHDRVRLAFEADEPSSPWLEFDWVNVNLGDR